MKILLKVIIYGLPVFVPWLHIADLDSFSNCGEVSRSFYNLLPHWQALAAIFPCVYLCDAHLKFPILWRNDHDSTRL